MNQNSLYGSWPSVAEVIALETYPVHLPDSPQGQQLLQRCRKEIKEIGSAELPDFLTSWGLERLVEESVQLEPLAYHSTVEGNAYLEPLDASLPTDHVKKMTETTRLGAVAYDQYPKDSILRKIYEWEPLMRFIGRVLELPSIYRYGDPMGALNLAVMKDGDYLRWHFDQTDFVTSLSIQASDEGGAFECVPMIRSAEDPNYEKIRATLQGSQENLIHIQNHPGTLVLFKGRYSLHRVTPIKGKRSRLMGLFGYDSREGVVSTDHLRKMRYGRTEPYSNPT